MSHTTERFDPPTQIFNEAWGEFDVANQTQIAMSVDPAFGTGRPKHFLFSDASGWTDHNVSFSSNFHLCIYLCHLSPIFACDSMHFPVHVHLSPIFACDGAQFPVHVVQVLSLHVAVYNILPVSSITPLLM